ncbi:GTPase [Sulfitobacter sp. CW3]|uniref:GTPase n=1 Tax=Sulfitobacter sp. CW3 TaxID=2861965 RepID=UPI001C607F86|nr:50S ribosome-binding GTPase [Sulfitobacter sp. CW3]
MFRRRTSLTGARLRTRGARTPRNCGWSAPDCCWAEISAGKSSRVIALVASNVAETDVVPTTDRPKTYLADFNGVASVLVDMQGLDGSTRVTDTVLAELQRADLVIWTIRANRPAREVDRASIAQFYQFFEDQPSGVCHR